MLTLKEFLAKEVTPALGCTEPGAVALATARARQELGDAPVERVTVRVSENIYKNGMNVGIPGAAGEKGNALAAAMSVVAGNADLGLEALRDCTPDGVAKAKDLLAQGKVEVVCLPGINGVYVEATVYNADHVGTCLIADEHSNIVSVDLDGMNVYTKSGGYANSGASGQASEYDEKCHDPLADVDYLELLGLADQMEPDDVDYLMYGVDINKKLAEYGLRELSVSGLGSGRAISELMAEKQIGNDLSFLVRAYTSAATDARMGGAQLPAMSAAGSGNQGISAIMPVAVVAESMGKSREETAKAVLISLLTTSFIRSRTGRVTPLCGSAVASGAGAAAGITVLLGGTYVQAASAMQIVFSNTAGLVCDGAKGTCALRVGMAASEAYLAALMSLNGGGIPDAQGIVEESVDMTSTNVAKLNTEGMKDVDRVMIQILEDRMERGASGSTGRDAV